MQVEAPAADAAFVVAFLAALKQRLSYKHDLADTGQTLQTLYWERGRDILPAKSSPAVRSSCTATPDVFIYNLIRGNHTLTARPTINSVV